jgi:hypothetical protein
LTAGAPPETGSLGFTIRCDNAPPSSLGLCLVTNSKDLAGSDPFGIGVLLHADLLFATEVLALDIVSDALGAAAAAAPIPDNPSLVGAQYVVCTVWAWGGCALPPYQLSSSGGLDLTILAP